MHAAHAPMRSAAEEANERARDRLMKGLKRVNKNLAKVGGQGDS